MTKFEREFQAGTADLLASQRGDAPVVTSAGLASLPAPVRRYVERSGAVERPLVRNFRAVFEGDFRNGWNGPWLKFRSEQYNRCEDPIRLFYMRCRMFGLPIEGLHVCKDCIATMRIRLARLWPVADGRGPEMDRGETVTLLNDLCILAPGALPGLDSIHWEEEEPNTVRAQYTHGIHTVSAQLFFNEQGDLINFRSEDRSMSADGKSFRRLPWSTPLRDYAMFGPYRLASYGETEWQLPEGSFTYGRFHLREIEYNLAGPRPEITRAAR